MLNNMRNFQVESVKKEPNSLSSRYTINSISEEYTKHKDSQDLLDLYNREFCEEICAPADFEIKANKCWCINSTSTIKDCSEQYYDCKDICEDFEEDVDEDDFDECKQDCRDEWRECRE